MAAWRRLVLAALALLAVAAAPAHAAPTFPALSGRVVDAAGLLGPQATAALEAELAALEADSSDQLVVVTVASLQGYEIEEYGYRLGRAWGIGQGRLNNGVLLIVAPAERKVRIEVGYGLEGVLTDALAANIIQTAILPRFRAGDMEGGVAAGAAAIAAQLRADPAEAKARADAAAAAPADDDAPDWPALLVIAMAIIILWAALRSRKAARRRLGPAWGAPVILSDWGDDLARGALTGMGGGFGGGGVRGGFGGGFGGFGGGGGSFGGGGASGGW